MRKKEPAFFLILFFFLSCRFSKPILCIPIGHFTNIDSATHNTEKSKYFHYFNLLHSVSFGGGSVIKTYDSSGKLISKQIMKVTRGSLRDGNNRYYFKEIFYDTLGHRTKIYKRIRQNYGRSASTVFEKTIWKN